MNAAGVGSFFNLMNFGQMYSYHVFLLPLAVVGIVATHILLVRKHGIVPPFKLSDPTAAPAAARAPDPVSLPATMSPAPRSGHEPVPVPALPPSTVSGHGPERNGGSKRNGAS
jgi:hypothetical protein